MPQPHDQFQSMGFEETKLFADKLTAQLAKNSESEDNSKASAANELKRPSTQFLATPQKVKEVRMFVDHLMIQSKNISPSREVSLAYTNMQRGFMWLGKVLQGLSEPNPYPESTNVNSAKIEERTDQSKDSPAMFPGMPNNGDRTANIKWFRANLDDVVSKIDFGYSNRAANNAEDAFAEAKMWFGQELNNIRLASI